ETVARKLARQEGGRGFDLQRGGLLRTTLLRLGRTEHVLLATMHHIVSDGWSTAILIGELTALYEAYRQGQESPLAGLAVPVWGLGGVAAAVAAGRSVGGADWLLARGAGRGRGLGTAGGLCATGGDERARRECGGAGECGSRAGAEGDEPARRGDAVHGGAGG